MISDCIHDIGRSTFCHPFPFHIVHARRHMFKETIITVAQIIQARFTIVGRCKTIFRTFPITSEQVFAFLTLLRQGIILVRAKVLLKITVHHLQQSLFVNIAKFKFRKHIMVASIYIAIKLHDTGMSACTCHRTYTGMFSHPVGKG